MHITWCIDRLHIQGIAVQYFQSLFSTTRSTNFIEIILCVLSRVGRMENNLLIAKVTDTEIENAIYQMQPTKSPSPDGFIVGVFHHH